MIPLASDTLMSGLSLLHPRRPLTQPRNDPHLAHHPRLRRLNRLLPRRRHHLRHLEHPRTRAPHGTLRSRRHRRLRDRGYCLRIRRHLSRLAVDPMDPGRGHDRPPADDGGGDEGDASECDPHPDCATEAEANGGGEVAESDGGLEAADEGVGEAERVQADGHVDDRADRELVLALGRSRVGVAVRDPGCGAVHLPDVVRVQHESGWARISEYRVSLITPSRLFCRCGSC
jgi:hypothetical protein